VVDLVLLEPRVDPTPAPTSSGPPMMNGAAGPDTATTATTIEMTKGSSLSVDFFSISCK
jgi:hypothetical protein